MKQSALSPVDRRIHESDTIAAVLPLERRDELAELLTDQDVATLRHLVDKGTGENTLRALTLDLAYLQAWSLAATGRSLPWPAPEALLLKFVADHLWDPQKRQEDTQHGMPREVEQNLRIQGFLKTVARMRQTPCAVVWPPGRPSQNGEASLAPSPPLPSNPPFVWLSALRRGPVNVGVPRPSPVMFWQRCWPPARATVCAICVTGLS